jgi:hypothetical protein
MFYVKVLERCVVMISVSFVGRSDVRTLIVSVIVFFKQIRIKFASQFLIFSRKFSCLLWWFRGVYWDTFPIICNCILYPRGCCLSKHLELAIMYSEPRTKPKPSYISSSLIFIGICCGRRFGVWSSVSAVVWLQLLFDECQQEVFSFAKYTTYS